MHTPKVRFYSSYREQHAARLEEDRQHNMFTIDKVILPDDQCSLNNFRNRSCNDFALLYLDRDIAFTYDDLHYGHGG